MRTETEMVNKGMDALIANLGRADAQEFIKLLADDRGDYTKCRQHLFHGMSIEEISFEATELWETNHAKELVS